MKKKIILVCIIILIVILGTFAFFYLKNYSNYKKTLSIIDNAKKQVLNINNVSITGETEINGKKIDGNNNRVVIKDSIQCDTDNRKYAEENNIEYRIINLKDNTCYTVSTSIEDKKIYINTAENKELYTIELLNTIANEDFTNVSKYIIEDDNFDNSDCYKISIYNKNSDINESSYWISKDTGLLLKSTLKYKDNAENVEEQCNINKYNFNDVTDEEIKQINIEDYKDYTIIDNR